MCVCFHTTDYVKSSTVLYSAILPDKKELVLWQMLY